MSGLFAAILAAAAVTIGAPTPGAGESRPTEIHGTIVAADGAAPLPQDSVARIWLETESSYHRASRRVAETSIPAAGKRFPVSFTLAYPAADVDPASHYQVRALISAGKNVLYFTRFPRPVALGDARAKAEIAVEPFGGRKLQVTATSGNVGLSGEWGLAALPGERMPLDAGGRPPTLSIDGAGKKISGFTGCNQFFGTVAPGSGNALSLDPSGMTRMACPDAVAALENAFLQALRATASYRIHGATLELLAGDRVLARFERRRPPTPSH